MLAYNVAAKHAKKQKRGETIADSMTQKIHRMHLFYKDKIMTLLREETFSSYFDEPGIPKAMHKTNYPLLYKKLESETKEFRTNITKEIGCTERMAEALASDMLALVKVEVVRMSEADFAGVVAFKLCSEMHAGSPNNQEIDSMYREARAFLLEKGYAPEILTKWEDRIKCLINGAKAAEET